MSEGSAALFADARIAIGAEPVSAAEPAGVDVRRESDFEALETEIRRMDADGPNAVHWRGVIDGATGIISHRSKDLLVGVWLAYGLAREEDWQGLAVGLAILRGMVDAHWEAMQPTVKRERARVGAAEWLVGRLVPVVSEWEPKEAAATAIIAAVEALDDLDKLVNARLTKEQAAFGELVRALRPKADAARRALAEAAARAAQETARQNEPQADDPKTPAAGAAAVGEAKPAAPPPLPAAAVATIAPAPAPPASAGPELERSVAQLQTAMRQYAEPLRLANLFDPRSFILLRTATWLGIAALPPQQNGRTALPPPPQDRLAAIELMRQSGKADDAVRALEMIVSASPFFLDGQRLVHDCLAGMGAEAAAAKEAVATQAAGFVRRLGGVLDLAFSDGRPFANAATRDWLTSIAARADGAQGGAEVDVASIKTVVQLAGSGKLADAFALLSEEMRRAAGGRAKFNLQLLEAQICLEANLTSMAAPLAVGLARTAAEQNLDGWEPSLAARAAEVTVRALSHAEAVKYVTESDRLAVLQAARVRLAGLDPAAAARLAR